MMTICLRHEERHSAGTMQFGFQSSYPLEINGLEGAAAQLRGLL
jgi:hypothetical protein